MNSTPPAPLWAAQILIDLKGSDPTALTAEEAIRHLLGFGERLVLLRRRILHELVLAPSAALAAGGLADRLQTYLARTLLLWNSNKHRAWIRIGLRGALPEIYACGTGGLHRAGGFGTPGLEDRRYDHLVIWARDEASPPEDLPGRWPDVRLLAYGRSEVYTLQWQGAGEDPDRLAWTAAVGPVRSRRSGLLVQPHFQESLHCAEGVPMPIWGWTQP